jgi:hypothetical protein
MKTIRRLCRAVIRTWKIERRLASMRAREAAINPQKKTSAETSYWLPDNPGEKTLRHDHVYDAVAARTA